MSYIWRNTMAAIGSLAIGGALAAFVNGGDLLAGRPGAMLGWWLGAGFAGAIVRANWGDDRD